MFYAIRPIFCIFKRFYLCFFLKIYDFYDLTWWIFCKNIDKFLLFLIILLFFWVTPSDCKVFFFGSQSPADMPLPLILFQNLLNLLVQLRIELFDSLGNILMNGTFWDSELFGSLSDRCVLFGDVLRQFYGSFFR